MVVGRGRVGSAIRARLLERHVDVRDDQADLVLLCVPDQAIGPWRPHSPQDPGSRT